MRKPFDRVAVDPHRPFVSPIPTDGMISPDTILSRPYGHVGQFCLCESPRFKLSMTRFVVIEGSVLKCGVCAICDYAIKP